MQVPFESPLLLEARAYQALARGGDVGACGRELGLEPRPVDERGGRMGHGRRWTTGAVGLAATAASGT